MSSLSLNALNLSFLTFLCSLMNCSFECRVITMNRCMKRLKERRPPALKRAISPMSLQRARSSSRALRCCGSIIERRLRPSGSLIFPSPFFYYISNFLSSAAMSPDPNPSLDLPPFPPFFILLLEPALGRRELLDAPPTESRSTSAGFIDATLLAFSI